ncbi:MAG: OmpA family protein [Halioglobus sp.]|nr:OmpA family protein [Halioglobus sp.]
MFRKALPRFVAVAALLALAACSSTPYAPVVAQSDPIDLSAYERKADTFIVLLDTSGSMNDEGTGRPRIDTAEDWTASFNNTVPDGVGFNAGIITFGKGATGSCIGYGIASQLYGPTVYNKADFANALGSIECAASTTPIADALTMNTDLLASSEDNDPGQIAVIIVSDFVWNDPAAVSDALADLRAQHPGSVCVHTVKVGDDATHDAMIASLTDTDGCDSAVNAADVASGAALTNYTASTLLSPMELIYEAHVVSGDVLFDFDKSVLKESGKDELAAINQVINSQGLRVKDIDLIGHTDSIGTEAYNQALSERRAKAVYDYLVSRGANASIIDVMGVGEADPAASNATAEGRALNRRVEVRVGTSP